jgi:hypothetical protein
VLKELPFYAQDGSFWGFLQKTSAFGGEFFLLQKLPETRFSRSVKEKNPLSRDATVFSVATP